MSSEVFSRAYVEANRKLKIARQLQEDIDRTAKEIKEISSRIENIKCIINSTYVADSYDIEAIIKNKINHTNKRACWRCREKKDIGFIWAYKRGTKKRAS